jgi:hypothetical protein
MYEGLIHALYASPGAMQTFINGLQPNPGGTPVVPTAGQSKLLNFLQNDFKAALVEASRDPDLPPMADPSAQP